MNNRQLEQYRHLLFWRNLFVFGSLIVMIIGFLLLAFYVLLILLPYVYIIGFVFLSKNHCPHCNYPFFLYKKDSLGSTLDLFHLFKNHCVNCGKPKDANDEKFNHG